jgi:hypothetical protein
MREQSGCEDAKREKAQHASCWSACHAMLEKGGSIDFDIFINSNRL